jgi:UDP-N-acetylmuramoyl-L-alanyl-D-glutamate--2,6-diaminopimelate ligase
MHVNLSRPLSRITRKALDTAHGIFPLIAYLRYGDLGKRMTIIGITGTDGKSSTVILTASILRNAGHTTAHWSSISYSDGTTETPNTLKKTTPGRGGLHAFLHNAVLNGCSHAVVEITSQGIAQHRHRGISFALVGITNITPEHIEAHGGFEQYRNTKLKIVRALSHAKNMGLVIEESAYRSVLSLLPTSAHVHAVALNAPSQLLEITCTEATLFSTRCTVSTAHEARTCTTSFGGPFTAHNIAFASTIATLCGVTLAHICSAIEACKMIPGRCEVIRSDPLVIVDYGHTLHALSTLLPFVRAHTAGKLVHVFGAAGGGRDRYKRPELAKLSETYTDVSILTEENSFDEPIEQIHADIATGFSSTRTVQRFKKREDAVLYAMSLITNPTDTLLLTAKGSETVIAGPKKSMRSYEERSYVKKLCETS